MLLLDFSGLPVWLEGLTPLLEARVRREWGPFVSKPGGEPLLRLSVTFFDEDLDPADYAPKAMACSVEPDRARFAMPEGSAEVDGAGAARIRIVRGVDDREFHTLQNLLRACLAWRLPSRGGALLHAAGLVLDGRAFVLVASEGGGKTTWARLGQAAGARVLSDDVVLLDGQGPQVEAVGSPFRSTWRGEAASGRWPLAAVLFPRRGAPAACTPTSSLLAGARLAANMPFVAAGLERDPRLARVLDRLTGSVPCLELTFAVDGSFVEVLRQLPGV